MAIYQADQYYIPFTIKVRGKIITPETIDDVRIIVGEVEQKHSNGSLIFKYGKWLYHLKAEESVKMRDYVTVQVEIVQGDNIFHSKLMRKKVAESLNQFKEI